MIEAPPLLTIKKQTRQPDADQVAKFRNVPACVVSDAMFGGGCLASDICHIDGGTKLPASACGPALTVDCGPADILAIKAALNFVEPGQIVVAAVSGYRGCAVVGDRVIGMLKNSQAAGFVTDGPMRDFDGIVKCGLPVWCHGLTPASPHSSGPGSVGLPVQIGGQKVETGDMIVADRDGVVVVPFDRLDEIAERLVHIQTLEDSLDQKVTDGLKTFDEMTGFLESDQVRFVD